MDVRVGENEIRTWRIAGEHATEVEVRIRIPDRMLIDLSPSDRQFIRSFDRPGASLADGLLALETIVRAMERKEEQMERNRG
jgi:hypothetical protein